MGSFAFAKERLIGGSFKYVPSLDAAIDWEKTPLTVEEYAENPFEGFSRLVFFEGHEPFVFHCHFLRDNERIFALQSGKLEIVMDSGEDDLPLRYCGEGNQETGLLLGLSEASQTAARLSIDSVEGFQEDINKRIQGRMSIVKEEILDDLAPYDVDILEELGRFVLNATKPKKKN